MAIVRAYREHAPRLGANVFVAENATIIGDVDLAEEVNVWYGSVLRGDVGFIRVGRGTNIQDLSMVHMSLGISNTEIGEWVTVGHAVTLHGVKVGDGALIGMGSVLLDNSEIGAESIVAAGTVVAPRTVVPPRSLVRGQPGKVIRELRDEEWMQGKLLALGYVELAKGHQR